MRELRNIVIRLTTKYAGESVNSEQLLTELDPEQGQGSARAGLPAWICAAPWRPPSASCRRRRASTSTRLCSGWERSYVEAALALTNGNLSQAAKLLGVHRTTLYSRMQNYMPRQGIDSNSNEH